MITGWLAPDGEFIECPLYRHYKTLASNFKVKAISGVAEILADLEYMENDCQKARDEGEHPEWHRYEVAESDAQYEIHRKVLDAGFIRVGENNGVIHFEGRPNHLKNKYQKCKDFANSYGADCVFDKVK